MTTQVSAAEMGEIATAQLVMLLAVPLAAAGLPGLVTREYFDGDDGPAHARRLVALAGMVAPVFLTVAYLAGPWWAGLFQNLSFAVSIQLGLWAAWPRSFAAACLGLLRAERAVGRFVGLSLASHVGSQMAGVFALVIWGGPVSFMAGLAAGQSVAAVLGHAWTAPRLGRFRFDRRTMGALQISWPIAVNSAAGLVVTTGDRVLIERLLGLDEVGRYQIVYLLGSVGLVVLVALNNAWAPAIYARSGDTQRAMLLSTTRAMVLLAATIAVGVVAASPVVLRLLAPPDYQLVELTGLVAMVAAAAVPFVFYLSANHQALVDRSTNRLAGTTIAAATVNVLGNLVLIPRFGLEGAGASTLGSYVVWAVLMHRRGGSGAAPSNRVGVDALAQTAPVLAGCGVLLVLLGWVLPTEGDWIVGRLLIGTAFVAGGLVLVRRSLLHGQSDVVAPDSVRP